MSSPKIGKGAANPQKIPLNRAAIQRDSDQTTRNYTTNQAATIKKLLPITSNPQLNDLFASAATQSR